MEREDYVSLEDAKLLSQKGFNECARSFYDSYGNFSFTRVPMNHNFYSSDHSVYSAPALYDVQKWLRKNHNIHIVIDNSASGYGWFLYKADNGTRIADYADKGPNDGGCWDTYEEALHEGILESLNRI